MATATAWRTVDTEPAIDLFDRIGDFLRDHHLSPDPAHYAFAHRMFSDPDSLVARTVSQRTEGGVCLSHHDIEKLGGRVVAGAATVRTASTAVRTGGDGLVARTQMQVEGFTDMMHAMRAETEGFGRDLAASADAIRNADALGAEEVVRLTGTMLERVRIAETRLEAATHEASELRVKLEEARDNARRDPLTDLPNRRAFEEAFDCAAASGDALFVAVCDVDHFKAVNDRFGHAVGDRVLKAISEALSCACAGHVVARYGGEEFAVLFRGVDCETARGTLETARRTVAGKRYRLRESDELLGEVTFSAGLTAAETGGTLASVFGRADKLLYAAKNAGRNRLMID